MTIHENHVDPQDKRRGKRQLLFCAKCDTTTLQTTPFFGYPFRCVANHEGGTKCDCCNTFVEQVAKVVVDVDWEYQCFCTLCAEPDSPEKQQGIEERRRLAAEEESKPVDLNDPTSLARGLGTSSFTKKESRS